MTSKAEANKVRIIEEVLSHVDTSDKQAVPFQSFILRYLGTLSHEDLSVFSPIDLFELMHSLWGFIHTRKTNEIKVRVINPKKKNFTHTMVEVNCNDVPFLVDSVRMEMNRRGCLVHYVIHMGGLGVIRDAKHQIESIIKPGAYDNKAHPEAVVHLQVDRQSDKQTLEDLVGSLQKIVSDVTVVFQDWQPMRIQLQQALLDLEHNTKAHDAAELAESKDFLRWVDSDHFTFLGYREYQYIRHGDDITMQIVPDSSLGVLRSTDRHDSATLKISALPTLAREQVLSSQVLIIAKTDRCSSLHRPAYEDYIGIKKFNANGQVIGERRFIGLYTSIAYSGNPKHIPFLRHKVASVLKAANLPPKGHAYKTLVNILDMLPRDDLFQAPVDELLSIAMGILHLQERQRIKLFIRRDIYGRYYSCLLFVPKDIFSTSLIKKFQHVLDTELRSQNTVFTTQYSESVLVRIHFTLRVDEITDRVINLQAIENRLVQEARSWDDNLHDKLIDIYGESLGIVYFHKYRFSFPEGYKENYNAHTAARDIFYMESITDADSLQMSFYRSVYKGREVLRLKLFNRAQTMPLSDVLPLLEHMGLRVLGERPNEIVLDTDQTIWINDFDLIYHDDEGLDIEAITDIFKEAFQKIWNGFCENDGFNRLVLKAGLTWRETAILRSYAHYLYQVGFTYSQNYIQETFAQHHELAKKIIHLFRLKFDPKGKIRKVDVFVKEIEASLEEVTSLDQDRIFRRYLDLINATLRTNVFQTNDEGDYKTYYAYKLASTLIPEIPSPAPAYETFVYSTRVVGVHLRGAKVARGGIRWSDRREDYRTEILGLMKAQQVKNSVIVPMGGKGGFYPKKLHQYQNREDMLNEGIACYRIFISALLDVVDNVVNGEVVHPDNTVCYDGDDTYFVVAADKGTATFSDIANEISLQRHFWLGDAFASGGSKGYDHKKMAITARGAWESVKRNFRERSNLNTQHQDFTVVGIGDMAGDVFGNGLLRSKHIRLVAAFNHLHIFLDPTPDAAKSYKERERLFKLPRSTWDDYDKSLMSAGGGVFKRTEKSITLSAEIKAALAVTQDKLNPDELIKAILTAPVDLLWNGGIGTFVKATNELHSQVGDKSSDAIRVNGADLRCSIVAEGGNLGFTQRARIEYAQKGGLIYTDFVDNSAGVDCSDHEVNIKILLHAVMHQGKLTEKDRNKLLVSMTDDVAAIVLRHNYLQTQSISFSHKRSHTVIDTYRRFISEWDKQGKINRELLSLPSDKILQDRKAKGHGMSKPEIAVLLSYTKILLKKDILESAIPEDDDFYEFLYRGFPGILCETYAAELKAHNLRREVIATELSNYVSNYMGVFFVDRMQKETGCRVEDIVRAYLCVVKVFNVDELWALIESLDYKISANLQANILEIVYFLVRRSTRWFLKNYHKGINVSQVVNHFEKPISELKGCVGDYLQGYDRENYQALYQDLLAEHLPKQAASKIALCKVMFPLLDIVEAAKIKGCSPEVLGNIYYEIAPKLNLDWLRNQIRKQKVESSWEEQMRHTLLDDIDWHQRLLSVNLLSLEPKHHGIDQQISSWFTLHAEVINRWDAMVSELKASRALGFTMYTVAIRALLDLVQATG